MQARRADTDRLARLMVAGASAEVAWARLGDVPGQLGHPPPGEWIMATPVGGPHYFIRRSWRGPAEG